MKLLAKFNGCLACLFLIVFLGALGSSPVMAKVDCDKNPNHPTCPDDPDDPPSEPDPGDPGASCANSGSNFPAFVYQVKDQLLLSNAAGDCRIAIYETDFVIPWGKSFRYFPEGDDSASGYGRLAWVESYDFQPSQVYTVEFHIDNGAVVEPLPLTPTPLTMPESDIGKPAFSADASQVYVTGCDDTTEECFIDVFDLVREERSRVFETTPDENTYVAIHGMEPGLEDQRLYFRLWPIFAPDGSVDFTNSLVYIERDEDGNWPEIAYDYEDDNRLSSEPTVIMMDDNSHSSTLSIGFWDYDGDGELNTVLSQSSVISPGFSEVEILDIENCVDGYDPCFVLGSRSDEGLAYEGDRPSLTSFSENPPSLLARRYDAGYDLIQLDLNTGILQTLIEAKNKTFSVVDLDSAD